MVDSLRRYIMEHEVLVFGLYGIVHTISDWNFGSARVDRTVWTSLVLTQDQLGNVGENILVGNVLMYEEY